ncbi:MAG: ATP-binding cassette domain-containing protein [Anaerolineales bacterium]|nr:ATP-binding cassette domain-containing protein [Anaerolineales bacterium]
MASIEVVNLQKTFQTKRKAAGLSGSLRALIKPEYSAVEAVHNLSFQMEDGELLGFIGPNGAGKSTTIKMLTGILHPSGGAAKVLGFTPWTERQKLAYHIGTVFGQRPQLWYHLPAMDTFILFGKIYELDDRETKKRIEYLTEAFEIADLLDVPVRKLSLGQRMRCEVAASLLHRPKLLLLDEPSIGLDVVAKQHIRDAIKRMNQEEGVGVLLTSHDAGDLEALCKRVIIVNHGQIVYEDKVSNLKRKFLTTKRVEVRYAQEVSKDYAIQGVEILKVGHYGVKLKFDTAKTSVDSVMSHLSSAGDIVDITISDPPLEEVIAKIYQEVNAREGLILSKLTGANRFLDRIWRKINMKFPKVTRSAD